VIKPQSRHSKWRVAVLVGVLSTAAGVTPLNLAYAQGIFDFLFGGFQHRQQPERNAHAPPPTEGVGRVAPSPLGQENVNEGGGSTGHAFAFCVRLCDGHHFPMERVVKVTPAETCRAICPYSRTKVFFGSEIGSAVAQDGEHYTNLDTAFVYRKQLVSDCTCNGKDAFGLSPLDIKNDSTLRPGDIVSTKDGFLAYSGKSGQVPAFTPVDPATLPANIGPGSSRQRFPSTSEAATDDDPGTIMQAAKRQPQSAPPVVGSQDHTAR
jgi:hypothetical protein